MEIPLNVVQPVNPPVPVEAEVFLDEEFLSLQNKTTEIAVQAFDQVSDPLKVAMKKQLGDFVTQTVPYCTTPIKQGTHLVCPKPVTDITDTYVDTLAEKLTKQCVEYVVEKGVDQCAKSTIKKSIKVTTDASKKTTVACAKKSNSVFGGTVGYIRSFFTSN